MTWRRLILAAIPCLLAAGGGLALAQQNWQWQWRHRSPLDGLPADRSGVPDWKIDERFKDDVFTFVRVQYSSARGMGRRGRWGGWETDWPDSDLNFSYRLQQLTSLKVNPVPITLKLTDEALFDYPFLYMIEPGALVVLGSGGRRSATLPAQRRLPDGGRLLGRLRVSRTSTARSSASSPTESRRSWSSRTRSSSASTG